MSGYVRKRSEQEVATKTFPDVVPDQTLTEEVLLIGNCIVCPCEQKVVRHSFDMAMYVWGNTVTAQEVNTEGKVTYKGGEKVQVVTANTSQPRSRDPFIRSLNNDPRQDTKRDHAMPIECNRATYGGEFLDTTIAA